MKAAALSRPPQHDCRALTVIATFAGVLLLVALLSGCASIQHRVAVEAEHTAQALSDGWDAEVDDELADCDTAPDPLGCIAPTEVTDAKVEIAAAAVVAALRSYWIGVGIGEDPKASAAHIAAITAALQGFPPEALAAIRGAR